MSNPDHILELKKNVVAIGRLLWEKELASALNGNISARVDGDQIVLTATKTCLGLLHDKDILLMKTTGEVLEEGEVSSEKPLHTEIYKNFPEANAVIHTHTIFANAYFLENDTFSPRIFESKFWFGEISAVEQLTPTVTDVGPIVETLRKNNIAVLKNHGVVAMGRDLFSCFLLIQTLEDAMKTEAMARVFRVRDAENQPPATSHRSPVIACQSPVTGHRSPAKKKQYKLFSKEQINEIVKRANSDAALKELGAKTQMTMNLAVKAQETGKVYSFKFENGKITKVGRDEKAEFLLTAPEKIWRQVFNREIDPFVATTQKKIVLRGDFAKLSKWFAPFGRVFQIWQDVPVE